MKLAVTTDIGEFDAAVAAAGGVDPYATLDWSRRWQDWELGEALGIIGTCAEGTVFYPVIRVPLDGLPEAIGRCDLRVAYDFGGPMATAPGLLERFDDAMQTLRSEWGVVTEFARLHPHRPLPPHAEPLAEHVVVDFARDGIESSGTHRRFVRRAVREGLSFRMTDASSPRLRATFCELYGETMARVGAGPTFRYSDDLLYSLMDHPRMHLAVVGTGDTVDATALFLDAGETCFYFLGCSRADALSRRPNNLLFHAAIGWARDRGASRVHLGGGGASLQDFKRRIGNRIVPYSLWRRVYDHPLHDALAPPGEKWFPPWYPELFARRFQ